MASEHKDPVLMPDPEATPVPVVDSKTPQSPWVRLAIDFVPLLIFFGVNSWLGIYWATGTFMVAMIASMVASRVLLHEIPKMLWVNAAIVLVFGGLTLWLHNDVFIKIKPTILYSMFAVILFWGLITGRPVLKSVLEAAYPAMKDEGWRLLTRNWAWFFLAMAVLNEAVWRNVSTDTWVTFKAWAVLPLSMLFAITQAPIMTRYAADEDKGTSDTPKS
ncbi:septation protein A [Pedomonas sp. V897]|uniref:septation protein A n=1 Tax=Pedomonas sp. V897 TaxID=3446482 RepID=UPI003EE0E068